MKTATTERQDADTLAQRSCEQEPVHRNKRSSKSDRAPNETLTSTADISRRAVHASESKTTSTVKKKHTRLRKDRNLRSLDTSRTQVGGSGKRNAANTCVEEREASKPVSTDSGNFISRETHTSLQENRPRFDSGKDFRATLSDITSRLFRLDTRTDFSLSDGAGYRVQEKHAAIL